MPASNRSKSSALLVAAILCAFAPSAHADDANGVGFALRGDATAKDLGVPIYPGAVARKDKDDDQSALTMTAWGGEQVFKLAVVKLSSPAPAERVAGFYRDALARFGDVLDCSRADAVVSPRSRDDVLVCERSDVRGDAAILKVGLPRHQRLVKIKDLGSRVDIDIVRIDAGR